MSKWLNAGRPAHQQDAAHLPLDSSQGMVILVKQGGQMRGGRTGQGGGRACSNGGRTGRWSSRQEKQGKQVDYVAVWLPLDLRFPGGTDSCQGGGRGHTSQIVLGGLQSKWQSESFKVVVKTGRQEW